MTAPWLGWAPPPIQKPSGTEGLGQMLQALGQMRQQQLFAQDLQNLKVHQDAVNASGVTEPAPSPRSRQMQQMMGQGILQNLMMANQPMTTYQQAMVGAKMASAQPELRDQVQDAEFFRISKIPPDKRTEEENKWMKGFKTPSGAQSLVSIDVNPASAAERTAIASGRASMDSLDNLKALFDNVNTKTGPIAGRVSPTAGLLGWTKDEQEALMAATSAFKNKVIKEITGAQMSEVEAKRIMKQIPDITDPPARWKAKWDETKKNLEAIQKRQEEVLRQSGMRVPEGDKGGTATKGVPLGDINPADMERLTPTQLGELEKTGYLTTPIGEQALPEGVSSEANLKANISRINPAVRAEIDKLPPAKRSYIWQKIQEIPNAQWRALSTVRRQERIKQFRDEAP